MESVSELKAKLRERIPDPEEFDAGFQGLAYSDTYTRHRHLVRYALGRLARHGLKSKVFDYEQMTIEHIASQSGAGTADDKVANIGNLILVSEELNDKLANKPFASKKRLLAKARDVWMDAHLERAESWGGTEIESRAKALAKLAREKVWKI